MIVRCVPCGTANRVPASRLAERARCGACKTAISPLAAPIAITTAADFDELVGGAPVPVLVDFWATWCGPCHAVAPEVAKLAASTSGRLVVAKIDVDAVADVAARFGIRSIPTMILFRSGREARRITGAMPASSIAQQIGVG